MHQIIVFWREMAKKKKTAPKGSDESANEKPAKGGLIGKLLTPVILAVVAGGTVYMLPSPEIPPTEKIDQDVKSKHSQTTDWSAKTADHTITLEVMTVSIRDDRKVLKIGFALETFSDEIDPSDPRLRDAFLTYLRAIHIKQLEDAAFHIEMREQLLRRARLVLGNDQVKSLLITDFLIT